MPHPAQHTLLTIAQACWCFLETAVQTSGIQCFTRILLGSLKLATGHNSVPQGPWGFRHRAAGEHRQQDQSICLPQSPLHLDQPKEATQEQNENSCEESSLGMLTLAAPWITASFMPHESTFYLREWKWKLGHRVLQGCAESSTFCYFHFLRCLGSGYEPSFYSRRSPHRL